MPLKQQAKKNTTNTAYSEGETKRKGNYFWTQSLVWKADSYFYGHDES